MYYGKKSVTVVGLHVHSNCLLLTLLNIHFVYTGWSSSTYKTFQTYKFNFVNCKSFHLLQILQKLWNNFFFSVCYIFNSAHTTIMTLLSRQALKVILLLLVVCLQVPGNKAHSLAGIMCMMNVWVIWCL